MARTKNDWKDLVVFKKAAPVSSEVKILKAGSIKFEILEDKSNKVIKKISHVELSYSSSKKAIVIIFKSNEEENTLPLTGKEKNVIKAATAFKQWGLELKGLIGRYELHEVKVPKAKASLAFYLDKKMD